MRQLLAVARYRYDASLRRRLGAYLSIVLLTGLIGGVAVGSIAAARRTGSSFSTYLASTNPSDLTVVPGPQNPADNYSLATTELLRHLPPVRHVEDASIQTGFPLGANGLPLVSTAAMKDVPHLRAWMVSASPRTGSSRLTGGSQIRRIPTRSP